MTLFEEEVDSCLNMIEYEYVNKDYLINREQLLYLIENMCLSVIYSTKLREEIYKESN